MYEQKPPTRAKVKRDPVYVATGSFRYRFRDGTSLRLREGVSPQATGEQLRELKRFKHIKEVK